MDKLIDPNIAARAYSAGSGMGAGMNTAKIASSDDDGVSFSDFLQKTTTDSIDTLKKGEEMSAAAVMGEANLTDVVQAVSAAEITLQTVVTVRDRLVSAYQEIMRMPI